MGGGSLLPPRLFPSSWGDPRELVAEGRAGRAGGRECQEADSRELAPCQGRAPTQPDLGRTLLGEGALAARGSLAGGVQ